MQENLTAQTYSLKFGHVVSTRNVVNIVLKQKATAGHVTSIQQYDMAHVNKVGNCNITQNIVSTQNAQCSTLLKETLHTMKPNSNAETASVHCM